MDLVFKPYSLRPTTGRCRKGGDSDNANGCTATDKIDDNLITIYVNNPSDKNPIDIAATILHEGLHAAIASYLNKKGINVSLLNTSDLLYYYHHLQDADADHYYMVKNYIDPLANALSILDNQASEYDFYKSLAWDGLINYGYQLNLTNDQMLVPWKYKREPGYKNSTLCKF